MSSSHRRSILLTACFLLVTLVVRGGVLLAFLGRLSADPDGYLALARNLIEYGVLGSEQKPSA
ncbi:MAG: hypothetical protein ACREHD_18060, partial [Pirellulales bacterium]